MSTSLNPGLRRLNLILQLRRPLNIQTLREFHFKTKLKTDFS